MKSPSTLGCCCGGAVLLAVLLADKPLALYIHEIIRSNARVTLYTGNMPDLLSQFVCIVTLGSWGLYGVLRNHPKYLPQRYFFRLTGLSAPVSYLLVILFKILVGRIDTRVWLSHPELYGFHWLHGGSGFRSFPSGHMTVFASLMVACWIFHPRYRPVYGGMLCVLGAALVLTEYHYLSDVIAGGYLGWMVGLLIHRSLSVGVGVGDGAHGLGHEL